METHRGAGGWLAVVILAHLLVTLLHGRAHAIAAVPLSTVSAAFIGIVIVAAPLAGLAMTRYTGTAGQWTIACSMTGAFVFGLVNHFVIESPDHVAHHDSRDREDGLAEPCKPTGSLTATLWRLYPDTARQ